MKMHSWGRYPVTDSQTQKPRSNAELYKALAAPPFGNTIARGMGRSYGDSALAQDLLITENLDQFISFDAEKGLVRCKAGLTLDTILRIFLPRGWFLPVVPGTRFVSVGGAIASDVHGKNHHLDGSFCEHVTALRLMLASGDILQCSPTENSSLFFATCAGMGLTGIIVEATLKLRKIQSSAIVQTSLRTKNIEETFALIEANASVHYSVAWLDCLARGEQLGRALLFLGEHARDGQFKMCSDSAISVPFSSPRFLLNRYTMSAFNTLYYHKPIKNNEAQRIEAFQYFFPLDNIRHWNRLYGRKGFLQYQCVIPDSSAREGIQKILQTVSAAGKGSFLSVLKKFGPSNKNLLSFPKQGYTLAMDFKYEARILPLLEKLDKIVMEHGGRLYLAKDARMSAEMFKCSYPNWEAMRQIREEVEADKTFNSLQSRRLGF